MSAPEPRDIIDAATDTACGVNNRQGLPIFVERDRDLIELGLRRLTAAGYTIAPPGKFKRGDRVTKVSGSSWTGRVVGTYSTTLTPEGYSVESENEPGSVQIYPAAALRALAEAKLAPGDAQ